MADTDRQNSTGDIHHLEDLGYSAHFQEQLLDETESGQVARVIGVRKGFFQVTNGGKGKLVQPSGNVKKRSGGLYPVVGDWVVLQEGLVIRVLQRRNALTRGAAGHYGQKDDNPQKEQVIAANLDGVFIVCGLDRDFNLRRIERFLTLVYGCSIDPTIILTKADLHEYPEQFKAEVEQIAFGVPVHLVGKTDTSCLAPLHDCLLRGKTMCLMGSSGAGKSTLINRLAGEELQETGEVSEMLGKGKHTTTSRDLLLLPSGGMIIDNPGIREIALAEATDSGDTAFPDIEELAELCRFPDCSHQHEPGCMVLDAVENGTLPQKRLENYHKMVKELSYYSNREAKSSEKVERDTWKSVSKEIKRLKKHKKRR